MSSSTWNAQPTNGDWNTASNWTPGEVPMDKAGFTSSAQTMIAFSQAAGTSVGSIEFAAAAPAYTFTFSAPSPASPTLEISGSGVANASMSLQSFIVAAASAGYQTPQLKFTNAASAGGSNNFYCAGPATQQDAGGGVIRFSDTASAGAACFMAWTGAGTPPKSGSTVGGEISFGDSSTADSASFTIYGSLGSDGDTFGNAVFHDNSTAAYATFTNIGGTVSGGDGGNTQFYDSSTAASAHFYNKGGSCSQANGGDVAFDGTANGGNGHFYNYAAPAAGAYGGVTSFNNNPPEVTTGGASAGSGAYFNFGARGSEQGGGGHVEFSAKHGSPTAANGTFNNYGSEINGNSSAGHTIFSISLPTSYSPTAGSGTFYNHPAAAAGGAAGFTEFSVYTSSQSASSNSASGQSSDGSNVPSAGNGTFYNLGAYLAGAGGGYTTFSGTSSAGNAILIAYGGTDGGYGGKIAFYDNSSGGTASVYLADNGELDLSYHTGGLTLGNLDLAGGIIRIELGANPTSLTLTGELAIRDDTTFSFQGSGIASGTPYTILTAPDLGDCSAGQFSGNSVDGMAPTFAIVGNDLQVTFA